MQPLRRHLLAGEQPLGKRGAGIADDERREPQVAGHARRGGNAVIRLDAREDEGPATVPAEALLKVRPDEGRMDAFGNNGFPGVGRGL